MISNADLHLEEDESFKKDHLNFSTQKRSSKYRRSLLTTDISKFESWFIRFSDMFDSTLKNAKQIQKVKIFFETWKNLFVENVKHMSVTDLIEHHIFTYSNSVFVVTRSVLYIAEKIQWQKNNLSTLIKIEIIIFCHSFWSVRNRFFRKFNETLWMIHVFCKLNDATIKTNHFMKRLEFILKNVAQSWIKHLFFANAVNEFWTISIYRSYVYKLIFSEYNDHYCYLRMRQRITENSETYFKFKNIVIDSIFSFNSESSLLNAMKHIFFDHFVDDDCDELNTVKKLLNFFHHHYFFRLKWAKLTLNFKKCKFFVLRIKILSHQKNVINIRSFENKLKMFKKWSSSKNKTELDKFLYMLFFLKNYISEKVDKTVLLKTAVIKKMMIIIRNDKKRTSKKMIDFI